MRLTKRLQPVGARTNARAVDSKSRTPVLPLKNLPTTIPGKPFPQRSQARRSKA
jgi:hypothetical protein